MTATDWHERAKQVFPAAGFGNFDPTFIVADAKGSRIRDVNGREYVDYLNSSGPMILGHGNEEVLDAVREQLGKGTSFFANNTAGIELAEKICGAVKCADTLRFVSTGGEADMYAFRLARAFTGRPKIMKFEGGYHGMSPEAQMSLAPEKPSNFPNAIPDSAGIPEGVRSEMLIAPYNDAEFARSLIAEHGSDIAAIVMEPFQRIIPPAPGFLQALREECDKHGILLVFDEIVTGFRFAWGGAQELYGVTPDVCTLGKIIGGGFPLAAIAGRRDIMECFDKELADKDRFLMHSGTLSGNPLASTAGLKTLEILERDGQYEKLRKTGYEVQNALSDPLTEAGIPHRIVGDPTLFDIVFTDRDVRNYRDVANSDQVKNAKYNTLLRENGILKPVGKCYPSLAHTEEDLELTATAATRTVDVL